MSNPKVYAMYLPQFHEIEENNRFWGKGFTDWVSVKNGESLFNNHVQPKVPLDNNYYDLSDPEVLRWQANLAKNNGIDGFCMYHYWFKDGKRVLETPSENLLKNRDIDIGFCFAWDNTSWVRSWSKINGNAWAPSFDGKDEVEESPYLLELDYGGKDQWKQHFDYLLPFFKDERYFKINNKPVFVFFSTINRAILEEMGAYWKELAIEAGLDGLYLVSKCDPIIRKHMFDTEFIYQPITTGWQRKTAIINKIKSVFRISVNTAGDNGPYTYQYDRLWKKVLREYNRKASSNLILGGFVNYDDTPRRGKRGRVVVGGTPEKFHGYFSQLYDLCIKFNKPVVFVTAWNEWGEGAYLEPDDGSKYGYLQAIDRVVKSHTER